MKCPLGCSRWFSFKGRAVRSRTADSGSLHHQQACAIGFPWPKYTLTWGESAVGYTFRPWRPTVCLPERKNLGRGWLTWACRKTGRWDSRRGSRRVSPPRSACVWWWARTAPAGVAGRCHWGVAGPCNTPRGNIKHLEIDFYHSLGFAGRKQNHRSSPLSYPESLLETY